MDFKKMIRGVPALSAGIVTFSWGAPETLQSNRVIAQITKQNSDLLKSVPIFTQRDIQFESYWNLDVSYSSIEIPGKPPTTLALAEEAMYWAKALEIDTLLVVAAPPHLRRCMRDLEYMKTRLHLKINFIPCIEVNVFPRRFWWLSGSTQSRVRSPYRWYPRELLLGSLPMLFYKLVAYY